MPNSNRSSKGFQQIPESNAIPMANPASTAMDIPLSGVTSKTGARRSDTKSSRRQPNYPSQQLNEKSGFLGRHAAGRRKTSKKTGTKGRDGEDDALTTMGMVYNKILNFSIITRYFLYVLPVGIILSIPIIIGATVAQHATLGGVRIVWIFVWLLIVWLSLWASKLTAKFLPAIFQFLCGIVSSGTRKYAMIIRALEIYLTLVGWALASLATFIPVMTRNPTQRANKDTGRKHWEDVVQSTLAAILISTLILLAEKVLVQLISISYHRTQFNVKIKESKHKIFLLSLLYDASRSIFPAYCSEFAEEDYIINDSIELGDGKNKGHRRSGSATPMRLLQNVGRFGDHITSAFGNMAQEVTGKQVFNPNSAHSIVVEALEKNRSSEALAKRLWMSFVVEGKEALYLEDVVEVLGADRRTEAEEAFATLDRDGNGDISLDEMILTVCEFGRERHSITNSLHDVDQAIGVLDKLLCTIIFIVCIFVFVAFLNSSFTTTLATAGTALLSLSFVFAGTAQEVLGSCIFLFVKHPFDVLDRVDVNGDQLIVKHISLLYTVFKYVNNHKMTQVPNSVLNTLWIQNVSRSEAMREQLLIYVSFDTSLEDIQLLKNEMHAFVTDRDNSRDFQPDTEVEVTGISEMNKMELKVEIRHKSNWANETVRAARRSKFMCALVLALRKIPINAPGGGAAALGSADQPTYSVSVSDAQAAANRDAFKKDKDSKRLFPTEPGNSPGEVTEKGAATGVDAFDPRASAAPAPLRSRQPPRSESIVLTTLNSRHPAADTANHPTDYAEPTTPKSLAHSVSMTEDQPDLDRSVSIEEVRGMLRRQSTRGKRKSPKVSTSNARFPPTSEKLTPIPTGPPSRSDQPPGGKIEYTRTPKFEYDPYTYVAPPYPGRDLNQQTKAKPTTNTQPQQQNTFQARPPSSIAESPIIPPQGVLSSQPSTTPTIATPKSTYQPNVPPKDYPLPSPRQFTPAINTSASPVPQQSPLPPSVNITSPASDTLSPTSPSDETSLLPSSRRGVSPVRNPFQITALKSQAQGAASVPRAVPRPPSEALSGVQLTQQQQQQPQQPQQQQISVTAPSKKPVPGPSPSSTSTSTMGINTSNSSSGPAKTPTPPAPIVAPAGPVAAIRDSDGAVIPPPRGDSLAHS